ncbi:MAG: hypothetical protein KatS3mg070_1957 [Meiothermus sp.]|uniref:hypothetical protein n=1 Tax=Meiothermus sp. TaxID=1955249 RepID=UPI0021DE976F|nr:hypothetical protein [Meiothermus sp.]GIW28594.1 MAG: hypothetical protein KatS3mg070_1957 [Meiothermus sp.]
MKRVALLGSVLALAFAGCGLISSPPINNPFGLDGLQTTINLGPSAAATGTANVTATFEDLTNLNLPANPSGFSYNLAISSVSFGTGCPATTPSPINVTMSATLTVSDNGGAGGAQRSSTASANSVQFTLTSSGSQVTVGNLTNGTLNLNVGQILPILQNGGQNTAVLEAQITTVSTPDLAGCAMTITWGGGQGVLRF